MMRLDALLVNKGLAPSRERAKELIKNGQVTVSGKTVTKASCDVDDTAEVKITGAVFDYVGRVLKDTRLFKKVREIDDQLQEERKKQKPDGGKMTRLMFEQLLRGMYINQFQ